MIAESNDDYKSSEKFALFKSMKQFLGQHQASSSLNRFDKKFVNNLKPSEVTN